MCLSDCFENIFISLGAIVASIFIFLASIVASIINFLINLLIIVCSVSLIVWIMFRHNAVKFIITDAELTQFGFDPNISKSNLHYNLSMNLSIKSHLGIHYDKIDALVYYHHKRLAAVSVPSFYQGGKSTVMIPMVFQGQNLVLLGDKGRRKFEDDQRIGVYGVDVELRLKTRIMFGVVNTWRFKPRVRCGLKLPLLSSDSPRESDFQPTKCHIHF